MFSLQIVLFYQSIQSTIMLGWENMENEASDDIWGFFEHQMG
jgi:hypothetical protein